MTPTTFIVFYIAPKPQQQPLDPDTGCCEQDEVSGQKSNNSPLASLDAEGWVEEMGTPDPIWCLVTAYFTTWAVLEYWETVQLTPEAILTALDMLESLVPPAHQESSG